MSRLKLGNSRLKWRTSGWYPADSLKILFQVKIQGITEWLKRNARHPFPSWDCTTAPILDVLFNARHPKLYLWFWASGWSLWTQIFLARIVLRVLLSDLLEQNCKFLFYICWAFEVLLWGSVRNLGYKLWWPREHLYCFPASLWRILLQKNGWLSM